MSRPDWKPEDFVLPQRPPMDVMVEAAIAVHGRDAVAAVAGTGALVRLVIPWEWPDPCPMPRRFHLFRRTR